MRNALRIVLLGIVAHGFAVASARATDLRACCLSDGSCADLDKEVCQALGDAYHGTYGSSCDLFICGCRGEGTGCPAACCEGDGICDDKSPMQCLDKGGEPQGEGTSCAEFECVDPQRCRITGGGMDCVEGIFEPGSCKGAQGGRDTFGGQVGAHGSEFGEWTHVHHAGPNSWMFRGGTNSGQGPAPNGTFMRVVDCNDEPACNPAKANGFHKQIDIEGVGTFVNGTPPGGVALGELCDVVMHLEDLGEPGKGGKQPNGHNCLVGGHAGLLVDDFGDCGCPDYYEIHITCGGIEVFWHSDYISAGNFQMHESLD